VWENSSATFKDTGRQVKWIESNHGGGSIEQHKQAEGQPKNEDVSYE